MEECEGSCPLSWFTGWADVLSPMFPRSIGCPVPELAPCPGCLPMWSPFFLLPCGSREDEVVHKFTM